MRALVMGWFSFHNGHATAGDVHARDLVCKWLGEANYTLGRDTSLTAVTRSPNS